MQPLEYNSWEARQNPNPHTHYDGDHIPQAMAILFQIRKQIENSIFEYCNIVEVRFSNDRFDTEVNIELWDSILADNIFPQFIKDHQEFNIFDPVLINKFYIDNKASFFKNIRFVLQQSKYYDDSLKHAIPLPLQPQDINEGWTAIIREFGLFQPLGNSFSQLSSQILLTEINEPASDSINSICNNHFSNVAFTTGGIKCPAQKQVQNHFGLCIALNMGLIRAGLYSPTNQIRLIRDKTDHFQSTQNMLKEYEDKITT